MNTFKVGDYVLVKSGQIKGSKLLAGKIGQITENYPNTLDRGYARLDLEKDIASGGIWHDELIAINSDLYLDVEYV